MKVLMFGWEFPPHISGGLGTACAGLTRALGKEHVHVLFVIPKLTGEERGNRTSFVSASAIPILQKKIIHSSRQAVARKVTSASGEATQRQTSAEQSHQTIFEISSSLSAYTSPTESNTPYSLRRWNYSFDVTPETKNPGSRDTISQDGDIETVKSIHVKEPYLFSGTYGPNLQEEVERYAQAASEIAGAQSFDIIHAHDWMTYPAGIAAKQRSGKPLVVHVHATEIDRSGINVNSAVFAIEKEGMEKADKVVTVSNWTKSIAVRYYNIDEKKIEVVHNGVTPKETPVPSIHLPLQAPVVTFLGRITHQKGPLFFVEAAKRVHRQFPEVHFVVAGSGDQLPLMIERIAQERLSGCFHFTGFLRGDDIDAIWSMSSVYVMPSVSEPFGITPLEALQAGVPVILTKQAGVSEVMPHAIKVDFWDSEALAEAICNVLRFKSLANTLKKNGSEEIKTITWDKAAKKLTTLYYELSKKPTRQKTRRLLSGSPAAQAAHPPVL